MHIRNKRKICIVSGSRAEYGLLRWLMFDINQDPDLILQIVATGMHLSSEFGLTYKQIEEDGFKIDEKVEMLLSSDTPQAIGKSIGLGVIGLTDTYRRLTPDIIVLLGDRFEIFAAAQAAMIARIPLAHIHGGEVTEGAIDETIRHCITKMSHLHFTATEVYRKRVIQLGESPARVFNVGAPGLDNLRRLKLLSRENLQASIGWRFRDINFLVTYHPVTLDRQSSQHAMGEILSAFDHFPDAGIIFTKPNADIDGRVISDMIDYYVALHSDRAISFTSLGQLLYLSTLAHSDVIIGNSSSGLLEAPSFAKPTVNIGDRQRGRLRAPSIIDCSDQGDQIIEAIHRALSPEFQRALTSLNNPYGAPGASELIKGFLKSMDLSDVIKKKFYDL